MIFRAVDNNSLLLLRYSGTTATKSVTLFKRVGGGLGQVQTGVVPAAAQGSVHRLEARFVGSSVQALWDGTVVFTTTVTEYQTATKVGVFWGSQDNTAKFDNFAAAPATWPSISSAAPASGAVGATITLTGTNFGTTQRTSTVSFNGTSATPTAWSDTTISVPVPSGATTGPIVVTVAGVASNTQSFTVLESPPSGSLIWDTFTDVEDTLVAAHPADVAPSGSGWMHWEGSVERVRSNQLSMAPTGTYTVAAIESGVADAVTSVDVTTETTHLYAGIIFRATDANSLLMLRYSGTTATKKVTLFKRVGGGFTPIQTGTVPEALANTVHRLEARYAGSTVQAVWDGTVVFTATVTDYQTATRVGVFWSSQDQPARFDRFGVIPYTPPVISGLSPANGSAGTSITLSGTNFGAQQGASTVSFNGTQATATSWTASSITVAVPSAATTGPVVVTVANQTSGGVNFVVTEAPPPDAVIWDTFTGTDATPLIEVPRVYRRAVSVS